MLVLEALTSQLPITQHLWCWRSEGMSVLRSWRTWHPYRPMSQKLHSPYVWPTPHMGHSPFQVSAHLIHSTEPKSDAESGPRVFQKHSVQLSSPFRTERHGRKEWERMLNEPVFRIRQATNQWFLISIVMSAERCWLHLYFCMTVHLCKV